MPMLIDGQDNKEHIKVLRDRIITQLFMSAVRKIPAPTIMFNAFTPHQGVWSRVGDWV